jgi:tellurite resistance protein TehA-like permease
LIKIAFTHCDQQVNQMQKPLYQCEHYSHIIRHFTPNWFTVNMGTGVVALGLSTLPFFPTLLWSIASGLWLANSLLFLIFLSLYALRWLCFYKEAKLILQHNSMLFFLGAIYVVMWLLEEMKWEL